MEEIKVGDYVRTKNQGIFIISHISPDIIVNEFSRVCLCQNEEVAFRSIEEIKKLKHSKNPIDLIEIKDLIKFRNKLPNSLEDEEMIIHIFDNDTLEEIKQAVEREEIEILSIVTHEQMSNIEYRLEN